MAWYVIHVRTGSEDAVCAAIRKQAIQACYGAPFELFVPKRKLWEKKQGVAIEVIRKMFPGYVLIQTEDIGELVKLAKKSKSVFRCLESEGEFQEVNPAEIYTVLQLANAEGEIGLSEAVIEHGQIMVLNGPLKGQEGLIKKVDRHKRRAKVLFWFSGREYVVELGLFMHSGV